MNTPSPEQIEQEGLYEHYQGSNLRWYVRLGTIGPVYEYQFEHEAINARICLNAAFQAGVAHVQAQAAPLAQGLVDAGDAMRDELQKKVVLDRLTNDKFPGSAECVISRWTQAKASTLPVADGEKERSGPSVEEVMEALRLAIKYIKESPCDPDIYDEQIKAWLALNDNPIAAELLSQER